MSAAVPTNLTACLACAAIDLPRIAAGGGGVWLFGSRAANCARQDSDWDLLVVTTAVRAPRRAKARGIDINYIPLEYAQIWSLSELGTHVSAYGHRLDDGLALWPQQRADIAAPRKQALVAARSEQLAMLRALWQPAQLRTELLRLRRNAQRGWLLSCNVPVPPTALLDDEWRNAATFLRTSVLEACNVTRSIVRLIMSVE